MKYTHKKLKYCLCLALLCLSTTVVADPLVDDVSNGCPDATAYNCGHDFDGNDTSAFAGANLDIDSVTPDASYSGIWLDNVDKNTITGVNQITISLPTTDTIGARGVNVQTSDEVTLGNINLIDISSGSSVGIRLDEVTDVNIGVVESIKVQSYGVGYAYAVDMYDVNDSDFAGIGEIIVNDITGGGYGFTISGQTYNSNFGDIGDITVTSQSSSAIGHYTQYSDFNTFGDIGAIYAESISDESLTSGTSAFAKAFYATSNNDYNVYGNIESLTAITHDSHAIALGYYGTDNQTVGNIGNIIAKSLATNNNPNDYDIISHDPRALGIEIVSANENTFGDVGDITSESIFGYSYGINIKESDSTLFGNIEDIDVSSDDSYARAIRLLKSDNTTLGNIASITVDSQSTSINDMATAIIMRKSNQTSIGNIGDIQVDSIMVSRGIQIVKSDNNILGDIGGITLSSQTDSSYALEIENSDHNTFGNFGDISSESTDGVSDGVELDYSKHNTFGNFGDITATSGDGISDAIELDNSNDNEFGHFGDVIATSVDGIADAIEVGDSNDNVFGNFGDVIATTSADGIADAIEVDDSNDNVFGNFGDVIATTGNGIADAIEVDNSNDNVFGNFGAVSAINKKSSIAEAIQFVGSDRNIVGNIESISSRARKGSVAFELNQSSQNTIGDIGSISARAKKEDAQGLILNNANKNAIGRVESISVTIDNLTIGGENAIALLIENSNRNKIENINGLFTSNEADVINFVNSDRNKLGLSGSITNNRADNITVHLDGTSSNNIITLNQDIAISGSLVTENSTAGEFNELHLNLGAGASYAYEPTGDWIIQEMNQRPMVEGSAYAAGVGNVTLAGHMMYSRSKEITDSLSKRSRSAHTQPPSSEDDSSRHIWADAFVRDADRDVRGLSPNSLGFDQDQHGVTLGFALATDTYIELIMNAQSSDMNIDGGNQQIDTDTFMIGALLPRVGTLAEGHLSAYVMAGFNDYESERRVMSNTLSNGNTHSLSTSDYDSVQLLAGLEWSRYWIDASGNVLDMLLGMEINSEFIESYDESQLFEWDSRDITQLQPRIELGFQSEPWSDRLTINARLNITHVHLIDGDDQDYSINSESVSFNGTDETNTYFSAALGMNYQLSKEAYIHADVQAYDSDEDIQSIAARVSLNLAF